MMVVGLAITIMGFSLYRVREKKLKKAKEKGSFETKIILPQVNHKRGERGQKSSVLSFQQIKLKITSKVKSRANDLYSHNSSISMKDYSTWNTAFHSKLTMRHFILTKW